MTSTLTPRILLGLIGAALAAALALPTATAEVPEGDLAALLPANTMLFVSIDDLSKALTLDPDGAMRELLRHEAVQQAYDEVYDTLKELQDEDFLLALNLDEEEIAKLFSGRVTFAIPEINLDETEVESFGGGGQTEVRLEFSLGRGVVALADFAATRDRLEELLENIATLVEEDDEVNRAQLVIDEFEGVRTYNIEVERVSGELDEPTWLALVDELLIVSDRRETLEDFVDLARHGAAEGERLLDDARYLDARDRVGRSDALLYINLGELLPLVNDFIRYQMKQMGDDLEMFVRVDDLIEAMQLDAVQSLFASLWVEDGEGGLTFGFTHQETDFGLHTLLVYDDTGVEIPAYFSPDFHSASISRIDLAAVWERFDELLNKASPYGHVLLQTQLSRIENTFPLRDAVLENLDSLMVEFLGYPETTQASPDDHPTQAYVVRVKDPQSIGEALGELGEDLGDDDPVEFMNEWIYQIPMPFSLSFNDEAPKLSFAVVENYVVAAVGEAKMVENVIAHIKNPGASLLDDSDLMDAFDALPSEDVVGLGFIDVADLLTNTLRGSDDALMFSASREDDVEVRERIMNARRSLEELPDVSDLRYYIVSKTYRTPDSFVQRMLLRPNLDG